MCSCLSNKTLLQNTSTKHCYKTPILSYRSWRRGTAASLLSQHSLIVEATNTRWKNTERLMKNEKANECKLSHKLQSSVQMPDSQGRGIAVCHGTLLTPILELWEVLAACHPCPPDLPSRSPVCHRTGGTEQVLLRNQDILGDVRSRDTEHNKFMTSFRSPWKLPVFGCW